MTRVPLPNRRPSATVDVSFGSVTVGYDQHGAIREVFAGGPKIGSDMQHLLADACVLISIALQHGASPAELGRSLGSVPTWPGPHTTKPASVIGEVIAAVQDATDG